MTRSRYGALALGFASVALLATFGVAACSETDRTNYDVAAEGGPVVLPGDGGVPVDSAPAPVDATAPDFTPPAITCASDAGPCVRDLVRGREHFCALLDDRTVRCWGGDVNEADVISGTLGYEPIADAGADAAPYGSVPTSPTGLSNIVQLEASGNVTCARDGDGGLRCWGTNYSAQLGLTRPVASADADGMPHPHYKPTSPALPGPVARVDVSDPAVCAELASGPLWCWGSSVGDALLRPNPTDYSDVLAPGAAVVPEGLSFDPVRVAYGSSVAVAKDGRLYSWGSNQFRSVPSSHFASFGGVLGRPSSLQPDPAPYPVSNVTGAVRDLSVSADQACAVTTRTDRGPITSTLWCWGLNDAGQLGSGGYGEYRGYQNLPAEADLPVDIYAEQVSTGPRGTCTRTTKGTVYCAGTNLSGRLGRPLGFAGSPSFVEIEGLTGVAKVAVGGSSACALLTNGTVSCWGSNERGQLGIGTNDDLPHPAPAAVVWK